MLKIFTTQVSGLLQRYQQKEEFEDAARLLAQAVVGQGSIYIFASDEMQAILAEAQFGAEPLQQFRILTKEHVSDVTPVDRVLIFTRFIDDEEAVTICKQLEEKQIPIVAVASAKETSTPTLLPHIDIFFDLLLKRSILPADDGSRFAYPSSLLALYVYFGIAITIRDILLEDEDF